MGQGQDGAVKQRPWPAITAGALAAASLLLFWPGVSLYDTVNQFQQVTSGVYYDWHPPVMARLWSVLHPLAPGAAPMLTLQIMAYWLGLGLLAQGAGGARAWTILAVGLFPPFLGWQGVVLKDGQMVGALACATGMIGYWRLRGRPVPPAVVLSAGAVLAYATLVRSNAAFATVPFAVLLLPAPRRNLVRAALVLAASPAVIRAAQTINRSVLVARESTAQRIEAIYDLAAIVVRTGDKDAGGFTAEQLQALVQNRCVKPLFWDPLGETPACEAAVQHLAKRPPGRLYLDLASAVAHHPLAYLGHRLAHLNATERWLVTYHWPFGGPPSRSETNSLGLADPWTHLAARWQWLAGVTAETPLSWPIVWVVLGAWGLAEAWGQRAEERRTVAVALFGSALCLEASFAVLSISSELRYHLWSMLATALGWALIARPSTVTRRTRLALALLALVITAGLASRIVQPPNTAGYQALLTQ